MNLLRDKLDRALKDRRVTVVAALCLVLIPTLFSTFPEWGSWSLKARVPIVLGWVLVAWFTAISAARQSEHIEELVGEPLTRRAKEREAAAARLIRALLRPESTGFPPHYEFRLFLPDEAQHRLIPSFESGGIEDSEGWLFGQGATGLAWQANNRVLVHGDAVSDDTHGLTKEQQERYKDLEVVAAMPVRDARDRPIAVLSVSSERDDGFLQSNEGLWAHLELAGVVARILIDILGRQD